MSGLRIVDVCEFYAEQGGGVRTYIDAKLNIGAALGHDVTIIVPALEDSEEIRPGGGRILRVKSPPLPLDQRYGMFWRAEPIHALLDRLAPDVVEASSPWRGGWIVAGWKGDVVKSLFMHLDPLSAFAYRWFDGMLPRPVVDRQFAWFWSYLRRLSAPYDAVICASPGLTDRLGAQGIQRALTVPMGIDSGVFSPDLRDLDLRQRLLAACSLGPDASLLLGIGRHTPEKRWPCVIDAVAAVAARRPLGFVQIGDGHSHTAVVASINGNPHMINLSPVRDRALIARIMASADALIHGSAAETFGLVVAEAIASGLPVIVPDAGGAADLAVNAESQIYATGSRRSAVEAIERMIGDDFVNKQRRARESAMGARTMNDHFYDLFGQYEEAVRMHRKAA